MAYPSASVVIPTYHRPHDLRECLQSLIEQTHAPHEVIVVDDGELPGFPLEEEVAATGATPIYYRKKHRGLTRSRNRGISLSSGDIVFFLDDDVVLLPDYVEQSLKTFIEDEKGNLGGVGGIEEPLRGKRPPLLESARYLLDLFLLNSGIREGTFLPSGFPTNYGETLFPVRSIQEVDFLRGGASCFRREVFDRFSFSEDYRGYGLGEDKDFTFRVSRVYRLLINPAIRFHHKLAEPMRYNKEEKGYATIIARYRFFRDHWWRGSRWRSICFWYAICGYALVRGIIAAASFNREEYRRMRGIFRGIGAAVRGEVSSG